MPNVNYRGKLPSDDLSTCEPLDLEQQDPDVLELDLTGPEPRDSQGMSSAPTVDPWPPLSRGQVVELHEALVAFTEDLLGVDPEDEGNWDTVRVAGRLEVKLRDLGIGRPAAKMSKRTWVREEPTTDEDSGPAPTQAELDREVQVVQEGLDLLMRAATGRPKRNCWTCSKWREVRHNGEQERECRSGMLDVTPWIDIHIPSGTSGPSKNADNCPGWEPKS